MQKMFESWDKDREITHHIPLEGKQTRRNEDQCNVLTNGNKLEQWELKTSSLWAMQGNRAVHNALSLLLPTPPSLSLLPTGSLAGDAVLPKLSLRGLPTGSSSSGTAPIWVCTMRSIHREHATPADALTTPPVPSSQTWSVISLETDGGQISDFTVQLYWESKASNPHDLHVGPRSPITHFAFNASLQIRRQGKTSSVSLTEDSAGRQIPRKSYQNHKITPQVFSSCRSCSTYLVDLSIPKWRDVEHSRERNKVCKHCDPPSNHRTMWVEQAVLYLDKQQQPVASRRHWQTMERRSGQTLSKRPNR